MILDTGNIKELKRLEEEARQKGNTVVIYQGNRFGFLDLERIYKMKWPNNLSPYERLIIAQQSI